MPESPTASTADASDSAAASSASHTGSRCLQDKLFRQLIYRSSVRRMIGQLCKFCMRDSRSKLNAIVDCSQDCHMDNHELTNCSVQMLEIWVQGENTQEGSGQAHCGVLLAARAAVLHLSGGGPRQPTAISLIIVWQQGWCVIWPPPQRQRQWRQRPEEQRPSQHSILSALSQYSRCGMLQ